MCYSGNINIYMPSSSSVSSFWSPTLLLCRYSGHKVSFILTHCQGLGLLQFDAFASHPFKCAFPSSCNHPCLPSSLLSFSLLQFPVLYVPLSKVFLTLTFFLSEESICEKPSKSCCLLPPTLNHVGSSLTYCSWRSELTVCSCWDAHQQFCSNFLTLCLCTKPLTHCHWPNAMC